MTALQIADTVSHMATLRSMYEVDETLLEEAAHPRTGEIRVRLQPQVWLFKDEEEESHRSGQYASWKGVSWIVQCKNIREVERLRKELYLFFQRFTEQ